MPDCAACNRPLGLHRKRCHYCGACASCCECDPPCGCINQGKCDKFDRDELGLDPETDVDVEE